MARTEELLAAVYASPDDDGPRAVLADHLLERGDPRGELIMLQLARARTGAPPSRRERKLLGQPKRWCEALAPVLSNEGARYERGFLAIARARYKWRVAGDLEAVIGRPEWATVHTFACRRIRPAAHDAAVALLGDPAMRSLRALYNVPLATALALERAPACPPLVELGLRERSFASGAELGAVGWRAVRRVVLARVTSTAQLDALGDAPLWRRLEMLTIAGYESDLATAVHERLAWVRRHAPQLRRIRLVEELVFPPRHGGWSLSLTPVDGGFALAVRFRRMPASGLDKGARLARAIAHFEPGTLRSIRFTRTRSTRLGRDDLDALRSACERHCPTLMP